MESLPRSKDGVPTFDGSAEHLAMFKEEALAYLFTLEHHKRYLAGPRLAQGLTGVARTVIRKKLAIDPQWLAHPRGAYDLIEHLEQALGQPTLIQAAQHIQKFFYQLKRKRNETMTQWTSCHSEALWDASRALQRVNSEHSSVNTVGGSSKHTHKAYSDASWGRGSHGSLTAARRDDALRAGAGDGGPFDENGRMRDDGEASEAADPWARREPAPSQDWDWDWKHSEWSGWHGSTWHSEEYEPPASWHTEVKDFIPEHLTGFLLLQRSGLDASERANVLAAIRGQFSVATVERALKEQWSDDDLMKRDKAHYSANLAWEDDEEQLLLAGEVPPDPDYEPEAYAAFMDEQNVIDSALEAIKEKKRTLQEARWRQQQVRSGRKFYGPPANKGGGKGQFRHGDRDHGPQKCLKCGGPHQTSNCPVPKKPQANVTEEAEVAFKAHQESLSCEQAQVSAEVCENIRLGKGIIDCGATATLGSVAAVEALMRNHWTKKGSDGVEVDVNTTPTFRFGNNGTQACVSTAKVKVDCGEKVGDMSIHVHDLPNQPILVSIKSLRALGAVVDFGRNEVIYRSICPLSVVRLEQAANGHLLMPLSDNLLAGATRRKQAFGALGDE